MEVIMSIIVALGLAAACGFRVFVPLAIVSVGARAGMISLSPGWDWLADNPALFTLAIASALEIGAYLVPWLDHALDAIATPASIVAGTIVAASQIAHLDPLLTWAAALIAGGGLAAIVQTGTVLTRAASTSVSAGLANPVVASSETALAGVLSIGALASPIVALIAITFILFLAYRALRIFLNRRRTPAAAARPAPGPMLCSNA